MNCISVQPVLGAENYSRVKRRLQVWASLQSVAAAQSVLSSPPDVFQSELAPLFADADPVSVAGVARLEQLVPEERFNPDKLMQDLKSAGKDAAYLPDADAIVAHLGKTAGGGDVVVVFSNGSFGGIHGILLDRLNRR